MPTVAVLCEFPTLLGGERSLLAALPAVCAAGFTPLVLAPSASPFAGALQRAGVQHIAWSVRDQNGRRRALPTLRRELDALLNHLRPDLVHANSLSMTRLAGPVVKDRQSPGLGHLRDIVRLSRTAVQDVNDMSQLLAVSEATRQFHVAQGVDKERVLVLYNGVDLREFTWPRTHRSCAIRDELELPNSSLLAMAIGQIGLRKGTDVFVELARCVLQRRCDVHFLIVGARTSTKHEAIELEAALRRRTARPDYQGHVHWLGMREDVPAILGESDLVIHAARQEPLGRVLLESAAAGCAIVATDVGGTPEIFPRESSSAVLIPPCEPQQVADSRLLKATLLLLGDPAQRATLGRAARRRVDQCFDAHTAGEGLVREYWALLGS